MVSLAAKMFVLLDPQAYRHWREFADTIGANASIAVPATVHMAHGLLGSCIWCVAGVFMLRAQNWARWLAIIWGLSVLILTWLTIGFALTWYTKLISYAVMLFFLCWRPAREFFLPAACDASHRRPSRLNEPNS